jgi:hypothetical protein
MPDNTRNDDPLSEEIRQDPIRPAEEVAQNQPGSKGDGSTFRAGAGNPGAEEGDDEGIVRSRAQKPNANQTSTQATLEPDGDLGEKRNTL